jgi:hypothetical protein
MRIRWLLTVLLILGWCYDSDAQEGFSNLGVPTWSSLSENLKVNTFIQVGFQWIGSNMTLPPLLESIPLPPPFSLTLGDADWQLKDANFWSGTVGFTVVASDMYSLFGSMGGLLDRPFVASGLFPVTFTGISAENKLQFSSTNVESWFIQGGFGVGPLIAGLYWDHFGFSMSDPRNQAGPLPNQTIRGDVITKSFCPFVGVSIPSGGATATVIYSPLAYSKATMAMRNSNSGFSETEYSWNKPGQFVSAMFQYNTPLTSSLSFGLWANYLWMKIKGDGDVTFSSSARPAPIGRAVTLYMGKYALGGGLSLGYNF